MAAWQPVGGRTVAGELLLEGALLHAQADLEWLDLIERRMNLVGANRR